MIAVGSLRALAQSHYTTIRLLQDDKPLYGYADFVGSDSIKIQAGGSIYTLSLKDDILMLKYKLGKDEKQSYGILSPDSLSVVYVKGDIPCLGQIKQKDEYNTTIVNSKEVYVCSTPAIEKIVTKRNASSSELKQLNDEMSRISSLNRKLDADRLAAERKALIESGVLTKERAQKLAGPAAWDKAPRYRGFVTINYSLGSNTSATDCTTDRISVLTSHGKYLKNGMFIGGGIGYIGWSQNNPESYPKDNNLDASIPVFLHVRTDFNKMTNSSSAPFIEARVGYAFGKTKGWVISPSLGWHFYFRGSKAGLSLNIGYDMFRMDNEQKSGYSAVQGGISFDF